MSSNQSFFWIGYAVLSILLACGSVYLLFSSRDAKKFSTLPRRIKWIAGFCFLTAPILSAISRLVPNWKKHTLSCAIVLASLLVFYFCMTVFFLKVKKLSKETTIKEVPLGNIVYALLWAILMAVAGFVFFYLLFHFKYSHSYYIGMALSAIVSIFSIYKLLALNYRRNHLPE